MKNNESKNKNHFDKPFKTIYPGFNKRSKEYITFLFAISYQVLIDKKIEEKKAIDSIIKAGKKVQKRKQSHHSLFIKTLKNILLEENHKIKFSKKSASAILENKRFNLFKTMQFFNEKHYGKTELDKMVSTFIFNKWRSTAPSLREPGSTPPQKRNSSKKQVKENNLIHSTDALLELSLDDRNLFSGNSEQYWDELTRLENPETTFFKIDSNQFSL